MQDKKIEVLQETLKKLKVFKMKMSMTAFNKIWNNDTQDIRDASVECLADFISNIILQKRK